MSEIAKSFYKTIGMARITKMLPNIPDPMQSPVKGALLEFILPGVHLISVVSVLDDALSKYIEDNGIPWPAKTKQDLFNRIEVVSKAVLKMPVERLHRIRIMRNSVAHSPDITNETVTWSLLDDAMKDIAETFVILGLIPSIPDIVTFFEREPTLFLDDLAPNGERMRHLYRIGAKVNETIFLEYSKEITYFPLFASECLA
jgi:hypothetical protein